ncbi:histidine phosphatase family protein [Tuberibacillus calidus]|uniref:histidine phosphatase family protein n=1 Tax=Tuberibacillus calidus TaxID=340097 RepID=UPI0003FF6AD8|nr:histidine phosphatase family protein [Tuberibacillus calidus]
MEKQIYLIRHCQAEGQDPDALLTDKGKKDAEKLADFLEDKGIEAIVSSPYLRAVQTATPLAKRLNLEIQTNKRFSERVLSTESLQDWLDCLKATFADFDLKFNGGESSREATRRAIDALHHYQSIGMTRFAVFTHGNLLTLLLHHFDTTYGFEAWRNLTNPDIFCLYAHPTGSYIKRIWQDVSSNG